MSKKQTPEPDAREIPLGCAWGGGVITVGCAVAGWMLGWWWLLVFCVPGVLVAAYWVFGKLLLVIALLVYGPRGIVGVLVISDSPNWSAYVRENWLERFGERFVVLNWSQRKKWNRSLGTALFRHFDAGWENYCPAVILLRGLRRPLVFRFFYAFRDHKHGNVTALRNLERRLVREMGLPDGADGVV